MEFIADNKDFNKNLNCFIEENNEIKNNPFWMWYILSPFSNSPFILKQRFESDIPPFSKENQRSLLSSYTSKIFGIKLLFNSFNLFNILISFFDVKIFSFALLIKAFPFFFYVCFTANSFSFSLSSFISFFLRQLQTIPQPPFPNNFFLI